MSRLVCTLPRLVRPNVRYFTRGQVRMADPKLVQKINLKQAEFQASNEPVHMIGYNKVHFYVTTVVGLLALVGNLRGIYLMVQ